MVVNDWFDRINDIQAGRPSIVGSLRLQHVLTILLGAIPLIVLPTRFLSGSTVVMVLAILDCCLIAAYSAPPIRLKDRGGWGVMADSLYAHVLPAIAAWFAVAPSSSPVPGWWMVVSTCLIVLWQFPMGFRGLLGHQINDYAQDKEVGENTLAVQIGIERSQELCCLLLIPVQAVGALAAFSLIQLPNLISLAGLGLYSARWVPLLSVGLETDRGLRRFTSHFNIVGRLMCIFWAEWFAIVVCISIIIMDQKFWPVILACLMLRSSAVLDFARKRLFC